jgi:hypothetical protein
MFRRPLHRLTVAFLVTLSMLGAQLALANYVCPGQADAEAIAAMMTAGVPCEGMDQAQPTLCRQSANGSPQSFEAVKVPVVSLPALIKMVVLPAITLDEQGVATALADEPETRPPPDPLFLSTLRLRV